MATYILRSRSPKNCYLKENGHHFNKESYQFAVGKMTDRYHNKLEPISLKELGRKMVDNSIVINGGEMYDCCYIYSMAMADFFGSSLHTERDVLLYIKDMLEDVDAADGYIFNRWLADMELKDEYIDWSKLF